MSPPGNRPLGGLSRAYPPPLAESGPGSDPYMEALHQLGADANAIAGGQVTIREYVTAEEHALLLAVRELKAAMQDSGAAYTAECQARRALDRAREARRSAEATLDIAQDSCDSALASLIAPQAGEGDCS